MRSSSGGAGHALDEGDAKATDIRSMREEKLGTATSVVFLPERRTDEGLRRFPCACTLAAIKLRCDGCLGGRNRSLTDLEMVVAMVTTIVDDASSWRGYRWRARNDQESV